MRDQSKRVTMLFLFRCGHKSKTHSSFLHFLLQSNLLYLQFGRKDRTFCFCHFRFLRLIPNVQGQSLFQLNENFHMFCFALSEISERMFFCLISINRQSLKLYVCLNSSCGNLLVLLLLSID
ncbi:unnamed protein product [Brassica napus]|uniref:(rape) hypothetical protein n=1 Tax=Brassica napus TaxID=3708 RepID=A0A816ISC1_BRANA|nr:unnamed protein product [Brassica napus]